MIAKLSAGILVLLLFLAGCEQAVSRQERGSHQEPGSRQESNEPIDRHAAHLILTRHARCRMDCRHITEKEIREVLEKGEINYNKSEPDGRPDPKYALEGYTDEGQHLRVIFAPSEKGLVVITCIELGVEWQCDCH